MGKAASKLSSEKIRELTSVTRFTAKDVIQWHKGFQKDCPNGHLSRQDFANIYKLYFPFGDSFKYSQFIFNLLDSNKDGILSFDEFLIGLDVIAKGTLEEKLEWSFTLFDLDEDGFISEAEMLCIVDSIYRMVGNMNPPDDEIDAKSRVGKIFKQMDLDLDGKLSRQEFIQGSINDPSIIESLNLYTGLM